VIELRQAEPIAIAAARAIAGDGRIESLPVQNDFTRGIDGKFPRITRQRRSRTPANRS
jgi:hypothetical protein